MILHLGEVEISYSGSSYAAAPKGKRIGHARRGKITAPRAPSNQQTTGDIAELLEAKYHLFETFIDLHEDVVVDAMEQSVEGALQNLLAGGPGTLSVTAEAESAIEARFKMFLSNREMDATGTPGVPTKAARMGVSHRLLHPYARRASRPSFVDTGLLQTNMKAWTTD